MKQAKSSESKCSTSPKTLRWLKKRLKKPILTSFWVSLLISGGLTTTWTTAPYPAGVTTSTDCQSWSGASNNIFVYKILLHNNQVTPLSIMTASQPEPGQKMFMDDLVPGANVPKRYALYSIGNTCYQFKDRFARNSVVLVTLLLTKSATSGCQVSGIISNTDIESCTGSTTNILSLLSFSGEGSSTSSFSSITYNPSSKITYHSPFLMKFDNFRTTDLNQDVVDMILVEPFVEADVEKSPMIYNKDLMDLFNKGFSTGQNPSAKVITLQNYLPRLVKDNLPGYFLGRATPADPTTDESILQRVDYWGKEGNPITLHILCYIEKPSLIVHGSTHKLTSSFLPFTTEAGQSTSLLPMTMEMVLIRQNNDLQIKVENALLEVLFSCRMYKG